VNIKLKLKEIEGEKREHATEGWLWLMPNGLKLMGIRKVSYSFCADTIYFAVRNTGIGTVASAISEQLFDRIFAKIVIN
jgi:hypothetical protein